jgi:hypothetical protein
VYSYFGTEGVKAFFYANLPKKSIFVACENAVPYFLFLLLVGLRKYLLKKLLKSYFISIAAVKFCSRRRKLFINVFIY